MPNKRNESKTASVKAGKGLGVKIDGWWSNNSFFVQLVKDFSQFHFVNGAKFKFRPPKTIVIGPDEEGAEMMLLHELGHAILRHRLYTTDLARLKMEAEAWEKAKELSARYGVKFREEVAQGELDTYREWLHQKSRCPECGLTRFQSSSGIYHCPRCENFCSLP